MECDTAPDGGFIAEIDTDGYITYVHHAIDGEWIAMDAGFRPVDSRFRQAQIALAQEHELIHAHSEGRDL